MSDPVHAPEQPTVFLAVRAGFAARFLLRTDVLPTLLESGIRVVVLTANAEEPHFREEFSQSGVCIEPLRSDVYEEDLRRSRLQRMLHLLRAQTLSSRGDLTTILQEQAIAEAHPTHVQGRTATRWLMRALSAVARRSRAVRVAVAEAETALFHRAAHADLFEKYRPAVLAVTSLGYAGSGIEPYLMREARRAGCQVAGVVLSWDNTSSKGYRGGPVDHVIAWTETMRQELEAYHDIAPDKVTVCGPAHFDIYYREPRITRADLFASHGLDPARHLITLGTKSPTNYPWNVDLVEMIAAAIDDGRLDACQLLVRLHPIYFRRTGNEYRFANALARMRETCDRHPHVHLDEPQILSSTLALDMPGSEMDKLAATLRHTSVLVNIFSTLNLEASIVDTPIVNVAFNGHGGGSSNKRQDVALDEAQPHNQRVVRSGGIDMVRDESELIASIAAYLVNPRRHADGRRRIRDRECGPNPGRAGESIGRELARMALSAQATPSNGPEPT